MIIPIQLFDLDGQPAIGVVPVGAQLEFSGDDAAPATADIAGGGAWTEIGDGTYTYQPSPTEEGAGLYVGTIHVSGIAGVADYSFGVAPGTEPAPVGRIALPLLDVDGNPRSGLATAGAIDARSELHVSIDGAPETPALGEIAELGAWGYYVYQGDGAELDRVLSLMLHVAGFDAVGMDPGLRDLNSYELISEGGGGGIVDPTAPEFEAYSPDVDTAPGDPGGFPASFAAATTTPIVIRGTDTGTGIQYAAIVRHFPDGREEVVYRRGAFRGRYAALSTFGAVGNLLTWTIRCDGGWIGDDFTIPDSLPRVRMSADGIDGAGNLDA